jgi:hypothetical protein
VGGGGRRVTPPESSAWIVGRASATTGAESSAEGARLNFGGLESSESRVVAAGWDTGDDGDEEAGRRRTIVAEVLGSMAALSGAGEDAAGVELLEALSELDDALRNLGRSLSSLLFEELVDELEVLSSELDVALRNFGRSGSLFEDLLDDVPLSSLELEPDRRNWGRSPDVGVPDELLAELVDEGLVMGCVGSSVACDAAACSSSVPSFTIAIVCAL